jgi:hypothetical protein
MGKWQFIVADMGDDGRGYFGLYVVFKGDALLGQCIVAAERVPLPVVGHEDPLQVGVARELYAEEVEKFSLVPTSSLPQRGDGGDEGIALGDDDEAQPLVVRGVLEEVNDLSIGCGHIPLINY